VTIAPENPVHVPLTDNDHILTEEGGEPDLSRFALRWSLGVSFHLRPDTPAQVRVYESESRAVLRLGGFSTDLDVYLPADQIDRLITLLTATRAHLR
jgi:hypothetical protein